MRDRLTNPFTITKASDFSDQQIQDYWVDLSDDGFRHILNPTSAMPMLILGSKGSGKTHLMRYFSYALQKLRHQQDIIGGMQQEGYVGIYLRCSGLNADRFSGKGQAPETWRGLFAYYIELWFAQLLLDTMQDAFSSTESLLAAENSICEAAYELFDLRDFPQPTSIAELTGVMREFQRHLDTAINNAVITRTLDVILRTTPGRLIFGLPKLFARLLHQFHNVIVVYLIDELEHLSEDQQRLIQTLLREKEGPCSLKIGARLYGIKTYRTYSDNEENKRGSEYDVVHLDSNLRDSKQYFAFARRLCVKRLEEAGYLPSEDLTDKQAIKTLSTFFESHDDSGLYSEQTHQIVAKRLGREPPYFNKLRVKLTQALPSGSVVGIATTRDVDFVIAQLQYPAEPLLEKCNILILYQDWYAGRNLRTAASEINALCSTVREDPETAPRYGAVLSHYKEDLFAQFLNDYEQKQQYLGVDTFIRISQGIPRHLLIILKNIVTWSIFNGEHPFRHGKISMKSQQDGISDAAEWFFDDARPGVDGTSVRDTINRLANLFRSIRYSDKPSECSLVTFSADPSRATHRAQRMLTIAEQWSLLIRVSGGQSDRNTRRVDEKYRLNFMLAPRWDLPTASRGALALTPEEVNAIFDPEQAESYDAVLQARVERMTAPGFGRKQPRRLSKRTRADRQQGTLDLDT